jgi:hypothetical protein
VRIADLMGQKAYWPYFSLDTFAGGVAGCVWVCVWVAPPESEGASIVLRDPRKRKSRMTAMPSRIPRMIPIVRSPTLAKRPRTETPGVS